MRVQGHVAGGVLAASAYIAIRRPPADRIPRLLLIGAASGAAPDLDILAYFAGKRSLTYGTDFRHHTWVTHTFPFYVVPAALAYVAGRVHGRTGLRRAAAIFGLATSVHLAQDMIGTGDGIMALYPASRNMYGVRLTGTHGPEWLAQYAKCPTRHVEHACVALAGLCLALFARRRSSKGRAADRT